MAVPSPRAAVEAVQLRSAELGRFKIFARTHQATRLHGYRAVERSAFRPSLHTGASRFEQLELDRPAHPLLHDRRCRPNPAAADQFADADFHDIAARVESGLATADVHC
jgi:hypothetical protein